MRSGHSTLVSFALKEHFEGYQGINLKCAIAINAAITTPARYYNLYEPSFSKKPLA